MKIRRFTDEKTWIEKSRAVIEKARTIALAGGSTPEPVYAAVNPEGKEWFQTDERYVPKDHPDSNQKMIRRYIPNLHAFDTSLPIEQCAEKYEMELAEKLGDAAFDLVVLGIGPDGHIASLFPHSPALHEKKRRVAHVATDTFPIRNRVTLTLPPIMNSKSILILLKGPEKAAILDEFEHEDKSPDEFPAKTLVKHPDATIYHLT